MKLSNFSYQYPDELIATHPLKDRDASRMMVVDRSSNSFQHKHVLELPEFLRKGDVLVVNDTRVFPARLIGKKETGGQIEILLLKPVVAQDFSPAGTSRPKGLRYVGVAIWYCITNQTAKLKTGMKIYFGDQLIAEVISRENDEIIIQFNKPELIENVGLPPLPPYIRARRCHCERERINPRPLLTACRGKLCGDDMCDNERYQTIYAEHTGSAAAPTAGLHLTEKLLNKIKEKGVHVAPVTLHVGLDTFSPVRVQNIKEHQMHGEEFFIPDSSLKAIREARSNGGRVIAVGTTSVRALESIAQLPVRPEPVEGQSVLWFDKPAPSDSILRQAQDERVEGLAMNGKSQPVTHLFIYPGYTFKTVDAILTNFHQPESTLIMMVSAFAGRELIMSAYEEAISERYRLFSYGDCMLII